MNRNIKKIAGVCLAFSFNVANAADVSLPVTFNEGDVLTAPQLNDNFNALKEGVNAKQDAGNFATADHAHDDLISKVEANETFSLKGTETGGNSLAPNGSFEAGLLTWELTDGSGSIVDTPNGSSSVKAFENTAGTLVRGSNSTLITIDRNKTYQVSGTFKLISVGSAGTVSLTVKLFKADGTEIPDDAADSCSGGSSWLHAPNAAEPVKDQWTYYNSAFGANTPCTFPDESRYMKVGFVLNADVTTPENPVAGNLLFQVQGIGISQSSTNACIGDMVSFGSGCISPEQTAAEFYNGQNTCMNKYKGSICNYNELVRACASGGITQIAATANSWFGDFSWTDNYVRVSNSSACGADIDGAYETNVNTSGVARPFRCCR